MTGGHPFPEHLGRYELLMPIGSGGMATVYLARATGASGFEREVALKLVHPHLSEHQELSHDLLEEAKLAARIRHPNVVPVLDAGAEPNGVYLVMDYVEGANLSTLVRHGRATGALSVQVLLRILADSLMGLHAAHELRDENGERLEVVHRDFSPQNIIVGVDGIARLTDFGIARASGRAKVTKTGLVKGKVAYMAPEQARGAPLDRRCDVWAAGVVAWELFAGRRLFEVDDETALLLKIVNEEPPRLRDARPEIPAALDDAIASALCRDVDRRLGSVEELRQLVIGAWKRPAEPAEVAAAVTRIVGSTLAERRARVEEVKRRRASASPTPTFAGSSFEADAPVTNTKKARAAGSRRALLLGLAGATAVAGGALTIALAFANKAQPQIVVPASGTTEPQREQTVQPPSPSPSASSPLPVGAGEGILVVEANAPIAAVRVDGKETTVARPGKRVSLPVEDSQRGRELVITAIGVDGRKAETKGTAGATAILVTFVGPPPKLAKPATKPHAPPSATPTSGLAGSPYKN